MDENTLVIFLSDNGGPTRELTSSNAPLRGEKGSMYEGGIRVPMILRWKERIPEGRKHDGLVVSTDLFATAADLAGARIPPDLDSRNLMPFLLGTQTGPTHETFFWRQGQRSALRHGDWKLVGDSGRNNGQAPSWELYRVANDPWGERNRAADAPEKLREIISLWEEWNAGMREPLFR